MKNDQQIIINALKRSFCKTAKFKRVAGELDKKMSFWEVRSAD